MDFCWQCFAPYGRSAAPRPVGAGVAQAVGDSPAPTGVAAGPLARPGGSAITEALRGPSATGTSSVPSEAPTGTSRIPAVVKVVVTLTLAVGGFVGWRLLFGGLPFPEEVAGQPRIENETTEQATELMSSISGLLGAELEVAYYGDTATAPAYVVYVMTLPEGSALDEAITVSGGPLAELESGGMTCVPDVQGSSCTWLQAEGELVGVGGFGLTPEDLRPVARDVRADIG
jgi:hypothetical protein